ncbi:aliphatic sulfonates family ABC transporter, periplasmic ligand-binding protein [Syntrophobotulus glycolicus DSM 8271]|uniref:Aliphatic sulfonates family ABC transporter, periplasmic ligand-binding protein n=1 Tax=Syntrophobotulus glycolicus (strain DSM 8271 / FlGlyR) TaxID=645991 RepID=F0T191_SYNGF|nr:ABC transporter substrate-binding protein [Syntrophobotulus glycolicus]ADY55155.1 aliphatic sulfonates family ABC transporter, periplasmic ligand-binding protein [Syntrophobotulus glycolicus DSM 8271]
MKKLISLLLVLVLSMIGGCSSQQEAGSNTPADKKITIGTSPYPAWYVWYIAKEENLFAKYGLNVDLVYFPVYSDSLQAFNTGKLDMLNIAACDTIAPYNQGVKFKIIDINDNSNGADGLVAKNKYKNIKDLKGQQVVTEYGTIEHFFLLKALESVGMKENDITYTNMTVNDSGMAMLSGKVEAACVWEPSLSQALAGKENHLIYSSADTPGLIPDLLIASDDLIKNNREDVLNLINAYLDALEFYNENPDKAAADMAKQAGVSADEMKQMMAGSKLFSIQDNILAMTEKKDSYLYLPYTLTETAKFLKSVNMIDNIPANPEAMLDTSFLEEISKNRPSFTPPDTRALAKK